MDGNYYGNGYPQNQNGYPNQAQNAYPTQNAYQDPNAYQNQNAYQAPYQQSGAYQDPNAYAQPQPAYNANVYVNQQVAGDSYFDGGLLQLIGWHILGGLITAFTLGICAPWAFVMIYRWEAEHTVVNGHRLSFDGNAAQLLGKWILWGLLTIITLGIYGLWVTIKLRKWKASHTHFAN